MAHPVSKLPVPFQNGKKTTTTSNNLPFSEIIWTINTTNSYLKYNFMPVKRNT